MAESILVSKVSKAFGSLLAVKDVSFEVGKGEVFGIAGPNGAGKTTLFNLVTGIPFGADSGTIEFEGRRIDKLSPDKIYRAGICRTFQQEIAFDSLTVEESLDISSHYSNFKISREEKEISIDNSLSLMGLSGLRKTISRDLPFFEKKKLMLATAICGNPKLLMLDEPAAGLSQQERVKLIEIISNLKENGLTIIIIEHVLPILFGVSDRIMVMDSGMVLAIDTPSEIRKNELVIEAYLGSRSTRTKIS